MHNLIISDDGPDSVGVQILKEAARRKWPVSRTVVMVTKEPSSGRSFSVTPNYKSGQEPHVTFEQPSADFYVVDGTPCDCLYLGLLFPTTFLGPTNFGVVLSGVNQGSCVGVDVLHSGTVAVASLAASRFGIPAVAFSQQVPKDLEGDFFELNNRKYFGSAEQFTLKVLEMHEFSPGQCLNVNFPAGPPKQFKKVPPALTSRWLPALPGKMQTSDISALDQGFITISDIDLTVAPQLAF